MNGYLLIIFYLSGLATFYHGLTNRKGRKLIFFLLCALFICVVISRQYGYKDYSDLDSYITRYESGDNAYFSNFYGLITDCIMALFGASATGWYFSYKYWVLDYCY